MKILEKLSGIPGRLLGAIPFLSRKTRSSGEASPPEAPVSPSEEALLLDSKAPPEAVGGSSGEEKPYNEEAAKRGAPRKIALLVLGAGLLGVLGIFGWKVKDVFFGPPPSGPDLRHTTKKEESLYCPLGFLPGSAMIEEFADMGLRIRSTSEEGIYRGSSQALEVFFLSGDHGVAPLELRVLSSRVPVKWGLGVGLPVEELLGFLGMPGEQSGDVLIYRDSWGNWLGYGVSGDRISRVEWHYPRGLSFEKKP